jgi:hypothetical protein
LHTIEPLEKRYGDHTREYTIVAVVSDCPFILSPEHGELLPFTAKSAILVYGPSQYGVVPWGPG